MSGVCVVVAFLLGQFAPGVSDAVRTAIYGAAVVFGGIFPLREAIEALRARRFEIDVLMLVAAAGAAALGEWADAALLLFLFSIAHALEGVAMGRARRAIEALADLAPKTALVRRGGEEVEVPVEDLVIGDTVVVRPNTRMPADGIVVARRVGGRSGADHRREHPRRQAARRGGRRRRVPRRLRHDAARDRVFAGTINGASALDVVVARAAADNTLARVVEMVERGGDAEGRQPGLRRPLRARLRALRARLRRPAARRAAPAPASVLDETFAATFYRAMAVLVAASPCALAISTPSAVLAGVARAARGGVLIKGGAHLEALGRLKAIAFDKTGTLTEGKPRLTDVVPADGATEAELLRVAVAVERRSDHPLAAAIVREGEPRVTGELPAASDLQAPSSGGASRARSRARPSTSAAPRSSARWMGRRCRTMSATRKHVCAPPDARP